MTEISIDKFRQFKDRLDKAKKILLIVHEKPDGDTLGSACALAGYLKKREADFKIFSISPIPADFEFLPFSDCVTGGQSAWDENLDLIVVLDSSNLKYAGVDEEISRLNPRPFLVNIDHHASNALFGDLNILKTDAASTTEIIYSFFRDLHIPLDADIATCLLNGMMTDTMTFNNAATTASVIEASARLLAHGAKFRDISRHIFFNKNLTVLKLWGKALSKLSANNPWGVAVTLVTQEDLKAAGLTENESTGLSNFLNSLDARAVMVLTEQSDGTLKGSLRTTRENVNVMSLAKFFGGGGHKKAAGFTIKGKIEKTADGFKII